MLISGIILVRKLNKWKSLDNSCQKRSAPPFKKFIFDMFWPCPATFGFCSHKYSWNQLNNWFDLLRLTSLSAIFPLYHGDQFSDGGSRSTRREPPTMGKQLVNFITCDCKSSAPFFVIYKAGLECRIGDRLVR